MPNSEHTPPSHTSKSCCSSFKTSRLKIRGSCWLLFWLYFKNRLKHLTHNTTYKTWSDTIDAIPMHIWSALLCVKEFINVVEIKNLRPENTELWQVQWNDFFQAVENLFGGSLIGLSISISSYFKAGASFALKPQSTCRRICQKELNINKPKIRTTEHIPAAPCIWACAPALASAHSWSLVGGWCVFCNCRLPEAACWICCPSSPEISTKTYQVWLMCLSSVLTHMQVDRNRFWFWNEIETLEICPLAQWFLWVPILTSGTSAQALCRGHDGAEPDRQTWCCCAGHRFKPHRSMEQRCFHQNGYWTDLPLLLSDRKVLWSILRVKTLVERSS